MSHWKWNNGAITVCVSMSVEEGNSFCWDLLLLHSVNCSEIQSLLLSMLLIFTSEKGKNHFVVELLLPCEGIFLSAPQSLSCSLPLNHSRNMAISFYDLIFFPLLFYYQRKPHANILNWLIIVYIYINI